MSEFIDCSSRKNNHTMKFKLFMKIEKQHLKPKHYIYYYNNNLCHYRGYANASLLALN